MPFAARLRGKRTEVCGVGWGEHHPNIEKIAKIGMEKTSRIDRKSTQWSERASPNTNCAISMSQRDDVSYRKPIQLNRERVDPLRDDPGGWLLRLLKQRCKEFAF